MDTSIRISRCDDKLYHTRTITFLLLLLYCVLRKTSSHPRAHAPVPECFDCLPFIGERSLVYSGVHHIVHIRKLCDCKSDESKAEQGVVHSPPRDLGACCPPDITATRDGSQRCRKSRKTKCLRQVDTPNMEGER